VNQKFLEIKYINERKHSKKQETDDYCKNQGNSHQVPPAHVQRVYYREDWPAAKISQRNQYVSVPTWDRMVDDSAVGGVRYVPVERSTDAA